MYALAQPIIDQSTTNVGVLDMQMDSPILSWMFSQKSTREKT